MPELPEVETTVRNLRKKVLKLVISDIWTDLKTKDIRQKNTVANQKFFIFFKKEILKKRILSVERRAKNILVHLSGNKTILIHLKMTGHFLFGQYKFIQKENKWLPVQKGPLEDPFNKYLHVVFSFKNSKNKLAFSDVRKFGKMTLINTAELSTTKHLENLGPEPLSKEFNLKKLKLVLFKKSKSKIKTVLINQSIIAGIGNIYSDEILWHCGIHPERKISELKEKDFKNLFKYIKKILIKGIKLQGDSTSDYRNIDGLPGNFQFKHEAYQRKNKFCRKKNCKGVIIRKIINNRSAHFCSQHQK